MFRINLKQLFILIFAGFLITSCDNSNPVTQEEHTDADGFILEDANGTEIYTEFQGESDDPPITIGVGEELELSVHFLDHEGNEIEHDGEGEDHDDELRISENDTAIAIIEVEEHCDEITVQADCEASDHCEWHADDNACEDGDHDDHDHEDEEHGSNIHIVGVSVGNTSFKLELMHGDHADYTSTNNVPVTVE